MQESESINGLKNLEELLKEIPSTDAHSYPTIDDTQHAIRGLLQTEQLCTMLRDLHGVSTYFGVSDSDFQIAVTDIEKNPTLAEKIRECKKVFGNDWAIIQTSHDTITLLDSGFETDVETQKKSLDTKPYNFEEFEAAIPNGIFREEQLKTCFGEMSLKEEQEGVNFLDFNVLCHRTSAQPVPFEICNKLAKYRRINAKTYCWVESDRDYWQKGLARLVCNGESRRSRFLMEILIHDDMRLAHAAGRAMLQLSRQTQGL